VTTGYISAIVTAVPEQLRRKGPDIPSPLDVIVLGMREQVLCSGEGVLSDTVNSSGSGSGGGGGGDGGSGGGGGGGGVSRIFSSPQALLRHLLGEQHRE
jgi:hypothetical protein